MPERAIRIENPAGGSKFLSLKSAERLVARGRAKWREPGVSIRLVKPFDPSIQGYDRAASVGVANSTELANTPVVAPNVLLGMGRRKGASKSTFVQRVRKLRRAMVGATKRSTSGNDGTVDLHIGSGRKRHLVRISGAVIAAYEDPGVRVHDLYSQFGISWEELDWILNRAGVPLRNEPTNRRPTSKSERLPTLRRFLPFTEAERQDLYRRAWGPLWQEVCVPRGY
jgi:hypothetical protein